MTLTLLWYRTVQIKRLTEIWKIQQELVNIERLHRAGDIKTATSKAHCLYKSKRVFGRINNTRYCVDLLKELAKLLSTEDVISLITCQAFSEIFSSFKQRQHFLEEIAMAHQHPQVTHACRSFLATCPSEPSIAQHKWCMNEKSMTVQYQDDGKTYLNTYSEKTVSSISTTYNFCYTPVSRLRFFDSLLPSNQSGKLPPPNQQYANYNYAQHIVWHPPYAL